MSVVYDLFCPECQSKVASVELPEQNGVLLGGGLAFHEFGLPNQVCDNGHEFEVKGTDLRQRVA